MSPSDHAYDEIITNIQSWSSDLTNLTKNLAPYLNNLNESVFLARAGSQGDPIDAISPELHSFAYLHFLLYRCKASHGFHPALMEKVWAFVNTCNGDQIRRASEKALSFAEAVVKIATESQQPIIAIRPLAVFIQRLQATPGQLTILHPLLAKTCLLAQSCKDILPILENDITDVNPHLTKVDYRDFLLYHYYGGMIYAYLKNFERALEFFRLAVSSPAEVASAIQVEAYKKFVLTNILQNGRLPILPKYTATSVQRAIKSQCGAYQEFATAYEKKANSAINIRNELEKFKGTLVRDKNYGLAKQCVDAFNRRKIQDLTRTYLTLSIQDIASNIGLGSDPEAAKHVEGVIVKMIEKNAIFATISHEHNGGMVSFLDDPNHHDNTITMDMINEQILKATEITAKFVEMDQAISSMPQYFNKGQQGAFMPDRAGFSLDDPDYGVQVGYDAYPDEATSSSPKRQRTRGQMQTRADTRSTMALNDDQQEDVAGEEQ
ncbi:COP9 signalosome complex subunit 3 [Podila humilis]|nr:COP9 signalosome complex subunit 3 [Podila humilis]